MFGWLRSRAKCPVDAQGKEWLERRMAWLADEFGPKRLRIARVVLPTPEFFPEPYTGTPEDARLIFDRVCGYMGLEPENIELSFYEERRHPLAEGISHGTAGLYHEEGGKYRVRINVANLNDALALVGTMAHELGHVHLLGHGRITDDVPDHEPLTDLLTVVLGLGLFTANSAIRESNWQAGTMTGWSVGRQGYLTMPMYGYAFALFAASRGEMSPAWAKHLRLDVRSAFKQGVRFLSETGAGPNQPSKK